MSSLTGQRVIVTGAKTGGHLYPAMVVGEALVQQGVKAILVSSGESIETLVLADSTLPNETLDVKMIKGMGLWRSLKGLFSLPLSLIRAWKMVTRLKPDAAVGFGGYTTGPLLLVTRLRRIPTAICEENAVPGLTNRILGRIANRIFVAFGETAKWFHPRKVVITGNPVRPQILDLPPRIFEDTSRHVLIIGGSQGSRFLNEKVPEVLAKVVQEIPDLHIRHQSGPKHLEKLQKRYQELNIQAEVLGYLSPITDSYRRADMVIARSGAGTVSEISAMGLPALFVPFAAAADNHQVANANLLVEAKGAWMVEESEFDIDSVARRLTGLLKDTQQLQEMAVASRSMGLRDGTRLIVEEIRRMVSR